MIGVLSPLICVNVGVNVFFILGMVMIIFSLSLCLSHTHNMECVVYHMQAYLPANSMDISDLLTSQYKTIFLKSYSVRTIYVFVIIDDYTKDKKSKSYLAFFMFISNFCQYPHARHSFATMIGNMHLLLPAINH